MQSRYFNKFKLKCRFRCRYIDRLSLKTDFPTRNETEHENQINLKSHLISEWRHKFSLLLNQERKGEKQCFNLVYKLRFRNKVLRVKSEYFHLKWFYFSIQSYFQKCSKVEYLNDASISLL